MTTNIPTTLAAAVTTLVELDVDRWGEVERAASQRVHSRKTLGLALNSLAEDAEINGTTGWQALRAAANAALTVADWQILRVWLTLFPQLKPATSDETRA